MPTFKFTDLASSEDFRKLPREQQIHIANSYWDDFEKENPDATDYVKEQRAGTARYFDNGTPDDAAELTLREGAYFGDIPEQTVMEMLAPRIRQRGEDAEWKATGGVAELVGAGQAAKRLAGAKPGLLERATDTMNAFNDPGERAISALADAGGDVDKAIETLGREGKQSLGATVVGELRDLGSRTVGGVMGGDLVPGKGLSTPTKQPALERLGKIRDALTGVPAERRKTVIEDAAKMAAWTEADTDKVRKLSNGQLVLNPGMVFGDKQAMIDAINATGATPEQKAQGLKRLDSMRGNMMEPLTATLSRGDSGFDEFMKAKRAKAAEPVDQAAALDEWMKQGENRNAVFKAGDAIRSGLAGAGLGIDRTIVGTVAGLTGGRIGAETQQDYSRLMEARAQAEKARGITGQYAFGRDLTSTVGQMLPMLAGGGLGGQIKGLAGAVTSNASVYGWAFMQGYESKLNDALQMTREQAGTLSRDELVNRLSDPTVQTAALANGIQTAVLAKVLGRGVERAALGRAAESMTVSDFIRGGYGKALADGTLRQELKGTIKTVFKDATDEAVEETLNQVLDNMISQASLGKDIKLGDSITESLYAGLMGGIAGGALPQVRRIRQVAEAVAPNLPRIADALDTVADQAEAESAGVAKTPVAETPVVEPPAAETPAAEAPAAEPPSPVSETEAPAPPTPTPPTDEENQDARRDEAQAEGQGQVLTAQPPPETGEAQPPADQAELDELEDLMLRKGQSENGVKGVKFTERDLTRFKELATKHRGNYLREIDPRTDELLGRNDRGESIYWSKNANTYYAMVDGRPRTAPWTAGLPDAAIQRLETLLTPSTPTPPTDENQEPETNALPPVEGVAPEQAPAGQVEEGAAQREGEGAEVTAPEPATAGVQSSPAPQAEPTASLVIREERDITKGKWNPNSVLLLARSFPDYQFQGVVQVGHDGTTEGVAKALDEARSLAKEQFGEVSFAGSQAASTDASGRPVDVVGPKGQRARIDSPEGAYMLGDIHAFRKDAFRKITEAKAKGDVETANAIAQRELERIAEARKSREANFTQLKKEIADAKALFKKGGKAASLDFRFDNNKAYLAHLNNHLRAARANIAELDAEAAKWQSLVTPTAKTAKPSPAPQAEPTASLPEGPTAPTSRDVGVPYSQEAMAEAFNLDPEQAAATEAIIRSMGLDMTGVRIVRGGTPGEGALMQGEQDAAYLAAVERGDMKTAQRMVDEAARGAGYNRKGVRFGFYVNGVPLPPSIADQNFGPGYYIAEDADPAITSGSVSVSPTPNKRSLEAAGLSEADVEFRRDVVYVKAQRPLQGELPESDRPLLDATIAYQSAVNDAYSKTGRYGYLNTKDRAKARGTSELEASISNRTEDHQKYLRGIALLIKQGKIDYDSLRGIGGRTYSGEMSSELVVQNPSQIKSADPVTYDAQGRVIPLSKRFDPTSPSILYQGDNKAAVEFLADGQILLHALKNPDFTSGVHELAHMARRSVLTPEEDRVAADWAGAKDGKWDTPSEEKFARGFERYLRDGKAPLERLQAIFDKIASWMRSVYASVTGGPLDLVITPEVRRIFDRLMANIDVPTTAFTFTTPDGAAAPAAVEPTPENLQAYRDETDPEEKDRLEQALIRGFVEGATQTVHEGPPPVEDTGEDPEGVYQLSNAGVDRLMKQYGFEVNPVTPRQKITDWIRQAAVREQAYVPKEGSPIRTAGAQLLADILSDIDPKGRVSALKGEDVALLTREGLRRKQAMDDIMAEIAAMTKEEAEGKVPVTEGGKTKMVNRLDDALRRLNEARSSHLEIVQTAALAKSAASEALHAWNVALQQDYTFAGLQKRVLDQINLARKGQGLDPINDLEEPVNARIREHSEIMLGLQKGIDDLEYRAAMERAARAEMEKQALEQKNEGLLNALADLESTVETLGEQVKARLEQTAAKQPGRMAKFKERLRKEHDAAMERINARLAAARTVPEAGGPTELHATIVPKELMESIPDIIIASSTWLATQPLNLAEFTTRLASTFGDWIVDHAPYVFGQAKARYVRNEAAELDLLPEEDILDGIDPESGPDRLDILDLARFHISQGAFGFEVVDRVTESLKEAGFDVSREDVVVSLTRYGRRKVSKPEAVDAELELVKQLERKGHDVNRLRSGLEALKSGYQKDLSNMDEAARAKYEALIRDKTREFRNAEKDYIARMREQGIRVESDERKKRTTQQAAKRRMENEITDLENAIASGQPIVKTTTGVEYTAEMSELRTRLETLRADYDKAFPKDAKLAYEEWQRRTLAALDRQIAAEESLIERMMLREAREGRPADTPEIAARRQLLADKRALKRKVYEDAHPGETALAQALKAAEARLKRRMEMIRDKDYATRRKAREVPDNAELKDMLAQIESLDDVIREARKALPLTPEQERAKLERTEASAIRARDAAAELLHEVMVLMRTGTSAELKAKLEPKPPKPKEPTVMAIQRETNLARRTIEDLRRAEKVGQYSDAAKEARRIGTLRKRIAEIRHRRSEGDYMPKEKPQPVVSDEILKLTHDLETEKFLFDQEAADTVWRNSSRQERATAYAKGLLEARILFSLTGDIGVPGRQLPLALTSLAYHDLFKTVEAMWNPRTRAELRKDGYAIARILKRYFKALGDKDSELARYFDIRTSGIVERTKGKFRPISPRETSLEIDADNRLRINPVNVLPWWALATLAAAKGAVNIAAAPAKDVVNVVTGRPPVSTLWAVMKFVPDVAIAALAPYAVPVLERGNRVLLNEARYEYQLMLEQTSMLEKLTGWKRGADFSEQMSVMTNVASGRGVGAVADSQVLSRTFAFWRWTVSQWQLATLTPLRSIRKQHGLLKTLSPENRLAVGRISQEYATHIFTTAWSMTLMGYLLGLIFGNRDEPESEKRKDGVFWNLLHPNFGDVRKGGVLIQTMGGRLRPLRMLVQTLSPTVVDRKKSELAGRTVYKPNEDRLDMWGRYISGRFSPNSDFFYRLAVLQEFRKGGSLGDMNALQATDRILQEAMGNLMIRDANALMDEYGPEVALPVLAMVFTGQNMQVLESDEKYKRRMLAEKHMKLKADAERAGKAE